LSRGEWKEYTWDFREIRGDRSFVFMIQPKTGDAGSIFFDDIRITAQD